MRNITMIKKIYITLSIQTKASIAYTVSSLFTRGLSIITVPIFTRIMSASEIGVITTYSTWQSIISVIATLSLSLGSINVAMLEFKDERDKYESSCLTLSTISSIVVIIIYLLFASFWNNALSLSSPLMYLMLISFIFAPATEFWLARQRYEYKYKATTIITISSAILSSAFAIGCVLWAKYQNIESLGAVRLFSQNFVILAIAIIMYIYIFYKGRTFYNKKYWSFGLKLSVPLIFHSLAKYILDISDRLMIASMVGMAAVGIYGTLYNLSSLSLIVWTAINSSLIPFMFEKMKLGEEAEKMIAKVINPILMIYGILAIMLTLVAPEIVQIMATKEYYEAIYIMPPVAAGIFLTSLYNIFSNVLMYHKKTNLIMISTLIAAAVNIILNYLLIPRFGYIVAAYTTLLAYIILAGVQYVAMQSIHKNNFFNTKYIFCLSTGIVVLCLMCNILYYLTYIRYMIIILIAGITFIFRKKIIKAYKAMKNM